MHEPVRFATAHRGAACADCCHVDCRGTPCAARSRYRGGILWRVPRQPPGRNLLLPLLRPAAVQIERQVRFRDRLAELLQALRGESYPANTRYELWNDAR